MMMMMMMELILTIVIALLVTVHGQAHQPPVTAPKCTDLFPGPNCDYDTTAHFPWKNGWEVSIDTYHCGTTPKECMRYSFSTDEPKMFDECDVLALEVLGCFIYQGSTPCTEMVRPGKYYTWWDCGGQLSTCWMECCCCAYTGVGLAATPPRCTKEQRIDSNNIHGMCPRWNIPADKVNRVSCP